MTCFEGTCRVRLNRHRLMGDGCVLDFGEFEIWNSTSGDWVVQKGVRKVSENHPSVTDAFLSATRDSHDRRGEDM